MTLHSPRIRQCTLRWRYQRRIGVCRRQADDAEVTDEHVGRLYEKFPDRR